MRRLFFLLILAALLGAQSASVRPPAAPGEPLVAFNPDLVEVVWTNGTWQLHEARTDGRPETVLKDFGTHQAEAFEALRLIRGLHLTQHGTVGTPQPIMEYWLSDGQAPQAVYDWARFPGRETVRVTTALGLELEGSLTHQVLLADGSWRRLDQVKPGDRVRLAVGTDLWAQRPVRLSRRVAVAAPGFKIEGTQSSVGRKRSNVSSWNWFVMKTRPGGGANGEARRAL